MRERETVDRTDYDAMRVELKNKAMKELRAIARAEGICLGYDGARKDTAVAAIVSWRRHKAKEAADG